MSLSKSEQTYFALEVISSEPIVLKDNNSIIPKELDRKILEAKMILQIPKDNSKKIEQALRDNSKITSVESYVEFGEEPRLRIETKDPSISFEDIDLRIKILESKSITEYTQIIYVPEKDKDQLVKELKENNEGISVYVINEPLHLVKIQLEYVKDASFKDTEFTEDFDSGIVVPNRETLASHSPVIYVPKNRLDLVMSRLQRDTRISHINGISKSNAPAQNPPPARKKRARDSVFTRSPVLETETATDKEVTPGAELSNNKENTTGQATFKSITLEASGPINFAEINKMITSDKITRGDRMNIRIPNDPNIVEHISKQLERNPQITRIDDIKCNDILLTLESGRYIPFEKIDKRIIANFWQETFPTKISITVPKDQYNYILSQLKKNYSITDMHYSMGSIDKVPPYNEAAASKEEQLKPYIEKLVELENKISGFEDLKSKSKDLDAQVNYQKAIDAIDFISTDLRSVFNEYVYDPNQDLQSLNYNIQRLEISFKKPIKTLNTHRGKLEEVLNFILALVTLGVSEVIKHTINEGKPLIQVSTDSSTKFKALKQSLQSLNPKEESEHIPSPKK